MPVLSRTRDAWAVATLAAATSVLAFLYCLHHHLILLYGDAEGHINIARRVFDSRTPGPLQLGTVWLPLPHLLMMPFLISDWAWRTAVGGSIPSMAAYVAAAVGIFRLARGFSGKTSAWFAVAVFAGNPSLIYLQTTAMTEPLYLALFVWSVVHLVEFARSVNGSDWISARGSLFWCAISLAGCTMTRYDGWIAMAVAAIVVLVVALRKRNTPESRLLWLPILRFLLICGAGPLLWFGYNAAVYRNPLEFANGPYSAKAIERRIVQPPHPGTGDLWVSELYFVRAAEMNLAAVPATGKLWLLLAVLGTIVALVRRKSWLLLMLWVPFPFYAFSVAYGGVPIFVPDWWPFGLYNLRYGLQALPAVAVFGAAVFDLVLEVARTARQRQLLAGAVVTLWLWTALQAAHRPASFLEADHNMKGRVALQEQLAVELRRLPAQSAILMALRDFPGAPQRAGVPLRRLINENDQRIWLRPADTKGLWERALASPSSYADYAVGFAGDRVDAAAKQNHLQAMFSLELVGQPRATIYRAR